MVRSITIGVWWRTGVWMAGARQVQRHVLYLGEINSSQQEAWRKTIEIFESGSNRARTAWLCFPKNVRSGDRRRKDSPHPARSTGTAPSRANGVLAGWPVCFTRSWSWTLFGLRGCRPAARQSNTVGSGAPNSLVSYRLIAPGSEWRLHREWFDKKARDGRPAWGRLPPGGRRHALPLLGSNSWNTRSRSLAHLQQVACAGRTCLASNSTCCSMI